MRYILLDTYSHENMGTAEAQIFESQERLEYYLRDTSDRVEDDEVEEWSNGLELYQIGEAIPVKVERTVLVTFGEAESAKRVETLDELLENALPFEEDAAAYRYGEGRSY